LIKEVGWTSSPGLARTLLTVAGLGITLLVFVLAAQGDSTGSTVPVPNELARFSDSEGSLPPSWQPLNFPKIAAHTRYQLVQVPGNSAWVIEATSSASASGLTHPCRIDLGERPILRWRWKVEDVLSKGDARRKDGDDYAARVYLTFEPSQQDLTFWERTSLALARAIYGDVPGRAINYLWANRIAKDVALNSAYVGRFVRLIAVRSGAGEAGRWHTEERDVYADYRELFGSEPPEVVGVAIMTDSDDTGESVRAWYGDLEFIPRNEPVTLDQPR
jgi:hypothetical protein